MITFLVRTAVTNYHRLGGLNHRNLFLIVLEAGKFKVTVPACSGSGKSPFPGFPSSLYVFTWLEERDGEGRKRERKSSLMSPFKGINPIMMAVLS